MKPLIVLVLAAAGGAATAAGADLSAVRKVFLMPMSGGLEQHLADQLVREGLFTVVVDPKQADAVWTERADRSFHEALSELIPPPKPAADKDKKKTEEAEPEKPMVRRAAPRSRGTIFLVDVASRQILWSTFLPVDNTSAKALHRAAQDIVKQFKQDRK